MASSWWFNIPCLWKIIWGYHSWPPAFHGEVHYFALTSLTSWMRSVPLETSMPRVNALTFAIGCRRYDDACHPVQCVHQSCHKIYGGREWLPGHEPTRGGQLRGHDIHWHTGCPDLKIWMISWGHRSSRRQVIVRKMGTYSFSHVSLLRLGQLSVLARMQGPSVNSGAMQKKFAKQSWRPLGWSLRLLCT